MATQFINLSPDVLNFIKGSLNDLIDPSIFGKRCLLHLPPSTTNCPNCLPDPISGKSSNIYLSGGPQPFTNGQICPVCLGLYVITVANNVAVYAVIEYKFDHFLDILKRNVRYPQNTIQTRMFTNDITNIKNCTSIETLLDVNNVIYQYKLLGEPIIPGKFTTQFCYAVWERM